MTIHYEDAHATVWHGDCVAVLAGMPDNHFDAVITDPPYAISFMSRNWDGWDTPAAFQAWCETWATECLRVLKPGGYLLAFGGTRTWHRLVCAVEDAGYEIRDSVAWLYGSGFPKSLDVSKQIDKAAGAEREIIGTKLGRPGMSKDGGNQRNGFDSAFGGDATGAMPTDVTAPATADAQRWAGYGTAMKPGHEPICVARKPLDGTVVGNVLKWGTGAVNIDAMRIGTDGARPLLEHTGRTGDVYGAGLEGSRAIGSTTEGRWPANVALDGETAAALDQQTGDIPGQVGMSKTVGGHRFILGDTETVQKFDHGTKDSGGASRFFYTAKAPADERITIDGVSHVTVKPLDLMQWLIRGYAGPKGALILDPFAGSGTTGEAAIAEGMRVVLVEQDDTYLPLIKARVTRRTDPVEHLRTVGEDLGLFGLGDAP